jgi:peptide/nickel transport system substrate-binding protein
MTKTEIILATVLLLTIVVFSGLYASLYMSINALSELSTKFNELAVKVNETSNKVDALIYNITHPPMPSIETELHMVGDWPPLAVFNGNPWAPDSWWDWTIVRPLMYRIPSNKTFIPGLAEYFELDTSKMPAEPAKLTIHLKKNYWHDGHPFTSKDVLMNHAMFYALWDWDQLNHVTGWELPDDNTIIFYVKDPSVMVIADIIFCEMPSAYHIFAEFEDRVMELVNLRWRRRDLKAAGQQVPPELDKEIEEKADALNRDVKAISIPIPIGNGPYYVANVTETQMVLRRFTLNNPKSGIEKIILHKIPNVDVQIAMFMSGLLDIGPSVPPPVWTVIKEQQPKARMVLASSFAATGILFNFRREPLNDLNFRKAIAYALNRTKIIEAGAYYGIDMGVYSHGILPSTEKTWLSSDTISKLTKYEVNYTKASEILEKAGYIRASDGFWAFPNGTLIELEIIDTDPIKPEEIARQLTQFGIKTIARVVPSDIYWSVYLEQGMYDMAIEDTIRYYAWYGDPSHAFRKLYFKTPPHMDEEIRRWTDFPSDQPVNTPWGPLVPEEIADIIVSEYNETKRFEAVQKAAYITNEYLPVLTLFEKVGQRLVLDGVRVAGWPNDEDPMWTLWTFLAAYTDNYLRPAQK